MQQATTTEEMSELDFLRTCPLPPAPFVPKHLLPSIHDGLALSSSFTELMVANSWAGAQQINGVLDNLAQHLDIDMILEQLNNPGTASNKTAKVPRR